MNESGVISQPSLQADEQDLLAKLQAAGQEHAQTERKLGELAAYMLRLEGALVYVREKLHGEKPVQAVEEAPAPA